MMSGKVEKSLVFNVEWDDSTLGLTRQFLLTFFPSDNNVEMWDMKTKKSFLRRILCQTIDKKDFYLGNVILVFSRRLKIVGYGNEETRKAVEAETEVTCALVMGHNPESGLLGSVIDDIQSSGFSIGKISMLKVTKQQAKDFYFAQREENTFEALVDSLCKDPIVAMELIGRNAVDNWQSYLGESQNNQDPFAKVTGSKSNLEAKRELEFFFPSSNKVKTLSPKSSYIGVGSTCCIIKPHAFKSGLSGSIIRDIQSRSDIKITALQSFHLQYGNAEEFYEIYKGIVQDYTGMVRELCSGRCLVLEISSNPRFLTIIRNIQDEDVVPVFREICGPSDPELCRTLRPHSLRAKYGITKDQNAVHCTDLSEDGPLEIEYFFGILNP